MFLHKLELNAPQQKPFLVIKLLEVHLLKTILVGKLV